MPQPCFHGADMANYFGFVLPGSGPSYFTTPEFELDEVIEYALGGTIRNQDRKDLYFYSPGDMVGLKLFGTTAYKWGGTFG